MILIVVALAAGVLVGLAMKGSLRNLGELRFRWWGLAFVGLGLQLIPVPSLAGQADHWLAVGLLVASYLVLVVFVVANLRVPGFALIALGFILNALVISINGGMPVSNRALHIAAGPFYAQTSARLLREGGEKHHLAGPGDKLVVLGDGIPVGAPARQGLSAGDVVWLAGTAWVIARGMARRPASAPEEATAPAGADPNPERVVEE